MVVDIITIGIMYGALVAMVQPNMKKLVAYLVSHLGFVVLGIFVTRIGPRWRGLPNTTMRRCSVVYSFVVLLMGLTTAQGEYTLTVNAADIQDQNGVAGTNLLSTSWLMDTTPPTSSVSSLPQETTSTSFVVSVTGSDPAGTGGARHRVLPRSRLCVNGQRGIYLVDHRHARRPVGHIHRPGGTYLRLLQHRHRQRGQRPDNARFGPDDDPDPQSPVGFVGRNHFARPAEFRCYDARSGPQPPGECRGI